MLVLSCNKSSPHIYSGVLLPVFKSLSQAEAWLVHPKILHKRVHVVVLPISFLLQSQAVSLPQKKGQKSEPKWMSCMWMAKCFTLNFVVIRRTVVWPSWQKIGVLLWPVSRGRAGYQADITVKISLTRMISNWQFRLHLVQSKKLKTECLSFMATVNHSVASD